jgi:hypothetical protein
MKEHFGNLLSYEGNRPCKQIHEIWKQIWMWAFNKLLDVQSVVFEFNDSSLVVVKIAIIGC